MTELFIFIWNNNNRQTWKFLFNEENKYIKIVNNIQEKLRNSKWILIKKNMNKLFLIITIIIIILIIIIIIIELH